MAEALGIKSRTLGSYERDESKAPYELIEALFKKLNINCNWLFSDIGKIFSKPQNTLELRKDGLESDLSGFGKRLNKLRINADLLSEQMCLLLDIEKERFGKLVENKAAPTLEEIEKICKNFNVTSDWLIFGKE